LILAPAQQRSVVTTINPARQPIAQTATSGRSRIFFLTFFFFFCSHTAICMAAQRSLAGSHALGILLPPGKVSLRSKEPGRRGGCQHHGLNRASPPNRHRVAELLILHSAVSQSSPVRILFPPQPTKLSLSNIKFNFMDGSVQPNFWQKRGRLHQELAMPRSSYGLNPTLWQTPGFRVQKWGFHSLFLNSFFPSQGPVECNLSRCQHLLGNCNIAAMHCK